MAINNSCPPRLAPESLGRIEALLGQPAYKAPGVLLYEGDSLALMAKLTGQLVDLTITSPPYNIGKEYELARPLAEYLDWCSDWVRSVHRLTKPSGAFWLNLGYIGLPGRAKAIPLPYLLWERMPFFLIQEVVWNYGAGVASSSSFSPRNEKFLWYVKDAENYAFDLDAVRDPDVKYPNQKKNGKLTWLPGRIRIWKGFSFQGLHTIKMRPKLPSWVYPTGLALRPES